MNSMNSVKFSPSDLHLRAASPGEKLLCWKRNFVSWGGKLSDLQKYIGRELHLGSQAITGPERMIYWILSTLATPAEAGKEDPETILAACETLKRRSLVLTKDSELVEGDYCYGVASVYTHPELNGKGLGRVLMERLAKWMDTEEADTHFSVLFSDVGKTFYADRGGWKPYQSDHIFLKVPRQDTASLAAKATKLYKEDLRSICEIDCITIRDEYASQKAKKRTSVLAAVLPVYDLALWHFANEEYVGEIVETRIPDVKGAKLNDVFMYWKHDYAQKKIEILRIGGLRSDGSNDDKVQDIAVLFAAAAEEAKSWDFTKIVAWNPHQAVQSAAALLEWGETELVHRESESITSLRWRGCADEGEIEWYPNEKYEWC